MRQAGIVAAAGVYALEHNIERLADDHARARRLAEGLSEAGVPVDLEQVETNFVRSS
jgi:threonine aldolase